MPGTYLHGEVVVLEGVGDALRHGHGVLADARFPGDDTERRARGGYGGAPVGGAGRTRGSTRTHGSNEAVGGGRGGGRSAAIRSAFSKQCDVSILRSLATLLS